MQQAFVYDGQLRIAAELNGAGTLVSRFIYGRRINVPEYMVKGGIEYRIVTDQVGSVRLVVNASSGVIAQRIDYDEFGRVLADSAPGFQPLGFAGGLYDRDTRLVRFGARDYDPESGRWMAKDPLSFSAGDANLSAYANSDPINNFDPSGLVGVGFVLTGSAAAGVGPIGAAAQFGGGGGLFSSPSGLQGQTFETTGYFAGGPAVSGVGQPTTPGSWSDPELSVGASAGATAGLFYSSAEDFDNFAGLFHTQNLDLPFLSITYAESRIDGTYEIYIGAGYGWGLSYSEYDTFTKPCR